MNTANFELEYAIGDDESIDEYVIRVITSLINDKDGNGKEILSELRANHWESYHPETDESEITEALENLLNSGAGDLREAAALSYGYTAPKPFVQYLSKKINDENLYEKGELADYELGVEYAAQGFQEDYYGSMCAGLLPHLRENPEELKERYETLRQMFEPVIKAYPSKPSVQVLVNILEDLKPN